MRSRQAMLVLGVVALTSAASATPGNRPPRQATVVRSARPTTAIARWISRLNRSTRPLVVWPAHRSRPTMIRGLAVETRGTAAEQRARDFLERHLELSPKDLELHDVQGSHTRRVVRFHQTHQGLPLLGCMVTVSLDQGGRVRAATADADPVQLSSVRPAITPGAAADRACQACRGSMPPGLSADIRLERRSVCRTEPGEGIGITGKERRGRILVVRNRGATPPVISRASLATGGKPFAALGILAEGTGRLVYRVLLPLPLDPRGRWHLVDATTGVYIGWRRGLRREVQR